VGREEPTVLICRCAWHPRYRGYPLINGIASWRGWNVRFTDGICEKCLERFRAEHHRFLQGRKPAQRSLAADPVTTASPAPHRAA
jgi:hypothetical protein